MTTVEAIKYFGRFDEGVTAVGFHDPRLKLALGALIQITLIIFGDHDHDLGAIREHSEVSVGNCTVMNRCRENPCHRGLC